MVYEKKKKKTKKGKQKHAEKERREDFYFYFHGERSNGELAGWEMSFYTPFVFLLVHLQDKSMSNNNKYEE